MCVRASLHDFVICFMGLVACVYQSFELYACVVRVSRCLVCVCVFMLLCVCVVCALPISLRVVFFGVSCWYWFIIVCCMRDGVRLYFADSVFV